MADELAQVIEIEFWGLKILVLGTFEMAKFLLKALRALTDRQEKFKEKWENFNQQREERIEINMLEAPGEKSLINLMKLSETQGGMVQVIKVPEKHIEAFLETCKKNGLRYSNGVDFLASDGMMPFFFAPKDYIIAAEILEQFIKKDLNEDREEVKDYAQRIKEAKAERESVPPEEKEKYDVLIENLEQAKQEREKTINESEQRLENGVGESFQEYLAEAKGTEFEKDPDKAVSEYDKGVVIDKSFSCEECLQPIRDQGSVPVSGMYFYLPEIGCVINRKFHTDENNLVYSSYTLKTDKGEIYEFSDKNITKKEWNENKEYLSALLDKAGVIPSNIPCRVFLTEEQLDNYITNHNKTETKAEKNVKERKEKGQPDFSSADAKEAYEYSNEQEKKRKASAKTDETIVTFEFPKSKVIFDKNEMKLRIETEKGDSLVIFTKDLIPLKDISAEKIEKGYIAFSVKKDTMLFLEREDTRTGKKEIVEQSAENMKKMLENRDNEHKNTQKRHEGR